MSEPFQPPEIGLPRKFDHWRSGQYDAALWLVDTKRRFPVQSAPTGFGKSPVYISAAVLSGARTAIVTGTKGLQDQVVKDFSSMGVRDIRGKANYKCSARPDWTCEDGHAGRCSSRGSMSCPYTKAYNMAKQARIVVTSYKYWMYIHKYGTGLGSFGLLVMDEAHKAPDELADILQIRLSNHEISELLGADFPRDRVSGISWKVWASQLRRVAEEYVKKALARISSGEPKNAWIRDYHHSKNLVRKLATIGLMKPDDWVWEEAEWGWQFDPIRFGRYAESHLFLKIPKVVPVSASVRPKTLHVLNVRDAEIDFQDYPGVFKPERSPIYWVPTVRVDFRLQDRRQWVLRMDQIMGRRMDRKGIIHSHSFQNRDTIFDCSQYRNILMSHWDKNPVTSVLQGFRERQPPTALVSPSITTGYDFPDDECRYQIIGKIPFPDSRSRIIKARTEADKTYGSYMAMQTLVQSCGRGCRSDTDWCENFIIDDHVAWFLPRFSGFVPRWFWERYAGLRQLPNPIMQGDCGELFT